MNRGLVRALACIVIASVAFFGFRRGERVRLREAVTAPAVAVSSGTKPAVPATPKARALPDDLETLNGIEFIAAMPELERRARGGDQKATRLLIERLQECATYADLGIDYIRQHVDEEYRHQLDIQQHIPEKNRTFVVDERWHADLLRHDLDTRDRCLALGQPDVERRIDWAELALARHERDVTVDLVRWGTVAPRGAERVREVDRLAALADAERAEIERLVESGDAGAMDAAAVAYSRVRGAVAGILAADPARAYAIAYALSLTGGADQKRIEWLLQEAGQTLSAADIEAAKASGAALHARCCASGAR